MQIAPQSNKILLNEQCGNNFQNNHSPAALTDAGGGRTCTKNRPRQRGTCSVARTRVLLRHGSVSRPEIKLSPLARTQDAEVRCLVTHFFRSQEPFPRTIRGARNCACADPAERPARARPVIRHVNYYYVKLHLAVRMRIMRIIVYRACVYIHVSHAYS